MNKPENDFKMNKKRNRFSTLQEPYNRLHVYRCVLYVILFFFDFHIFMLLHYLTHSWQTTYLQKNYFLNNLKYILLSI